jgi:hypothetical protein
MACFTVTKENQTAAERAEQAKASLKRLEEKLLSGAVKVVIAPNGAVAFTGWNDRDDLTDVCAFRVLTAQKSYALGRAVLAAEMIQGRKVNAQAVNAGFHSHDGGRTWSRH